jgi:deoxyxylulose-5-phosphate synthase
MSNNSRNNILRIQKDISNLMQQGKSSQEIMDLLHIPLRSYRRYTAAINKQEKNAWYSLVKNELATELLRLKSSYEESFTKSRELANTSSVTTDVLLALEAKDSAMLNIVRLLVEGTELLMKQQQHPVKYHKVGQNTIMMQPHP